MSEGSRGWPTQTQSNAKEGGEVVRTYSTGVTRLVGLLLQYDVNATYHCHLGIGELNSGQWSNFSLITVTVKL